MNIKSDLYNFSILNNPEKIQFLEWDFYASIEGIEEKELNSLMRKIIQDEKENSYIRKISLELFTELVIIGKLKKRHGLSLLIDDWLTNADVFIEQRRLKDLFLYYEIGEVDIETIYINNIDHIETEIVSESYFNLGLIHFQKALNASTKELCLQELEKSKSHFEKSSIVIENQVNSEYYGNIISTLIELLKGLWGSASTLIKDLTNLLFNKEVFSFKYELDNFQFGLYKILGSLQKICNEKPNEWLNFRIGLDDIYLNYSEITNSSLKQRLNKKCVVNDFAQLTKKWFLEPYFSINLSSEITKLNIRLGEFIVGTNEHNFLLFLKSIIENDSKKNFELESIEKNFQKLFPSISAIEIEQTIKNIGSPIEYLSAFESLSAKSNETLIGNLIYACSKLQGDKYYWGKAVDENQRNKYIANLLEASGFTIKDQPEWSVSAEGKNSGEIDIFVTEKNGSPKSIIEALNLDSLKSDYIELHIDKLFKYDTTGLQNNYLITYSTAKNFITLWDKYKIFISKHNYVYKFRKFSEINDYNYTDIKIGVAEHQRNGKIIYLYHIMINLHDR